MKKPLIVGAAALGVLAAVAASQGSSLARSKCFHKVLTLPAPTDYRYPSDKDVSDYWAFYREEYGQDASCSSADLNGDGIPDYATIGISTTGTGFAVVILYSKTKQYEPRVVWTDSAQVYRLTDSAIGILKRGRYKKLMGCRNDTVDITMPATAIHYFNRLPYSLEKAYPKLTKPEHRLFWSLNKGKTITHRDLCTAEDWARYENVAADTRR
jgi:hypothetical protein